MNQDPHWLSQFYKGWTKSDLEHRLNELIMSDHTEREKEQIQAEIERREVEHGIQAQ